MLDRKKKTLQPLTFQRALVTGATGCIGRCLVKRLLSTGCQFKVLVRSASRFHQLFGSLRNGAVQVIQGNLCDSAAAAEAVARVEVVFHAAGEAHLVPRSRQEKENFYRVNVAGTENLLRSCRGENVHAFVHFSTIGVHGPNPDVPLTEETPCRPDGDYARSKYLADQKVMEYFRTCNLRPTILRLCLVYGEGDRGNFLRMLRRIESRRFFYVGSGETKKSISYVENVVDAALLAAQNSSAQGEVLLVSDPSPYPFRQIAATIARQLGVPEPRWHLPAPFLYSVGRCFDALQLVGIRGPFSARDVNTLTTDIVCQVSKIRTLLGFRAKIGLEEGVSRTVRWYREETKRQQVRD